MEQDRHRREQPSGRRAGTAVRTRPLRTRPLRTARIKAAVSTELPNHGIHPTDGLGGARRRAIGAVTGKGQRDGNRYWVIPTREHRQAATEARYLR